MNLKRFLLLAIFAIIGYTSQAQVSTPFTPRFQTTQKGGIVFIGNVAVSCAVNPPVAGGTCQTGTAEVPPSGTYQDNSFNAVYVDVDGDPSTFQSSSDSLALASCSQITWAGLYWGGNSNTTKGSKVKIKSNNGAYQLITADDSLTNTVGFSTYHCYKNVTNIVRAAGINARFTVADIPNGNIGTANKFGSWIIVVVYRNDLQNMRQLTVFNGLANISGSATVDIPISGFLTPPTGPVTVEFGCYVHDGDRGLTGDQLLFNGVSSFVNISDVLNPTTNVMNSTVSNKGIENPFRIPMLHNTAGLDADIFAPNNTAKNYLGNSATTGTFRMTTSSETYLPQVITTAIDVYSPDDRAAVQVLDLNGGLVEPGDTLEYTVVGKNIGSDPSINTFITDTLEQNAVFVSGSIHITAGQNLGFKTDALADDQAEYDAATRVIKVRVGAGANGITGGQMNNSVFGTDSTQLKFKVTATTDCYKLKCDNVINNSALITGTGVTGGQTYTNASNPGIFDINGCPIPGATTTPINASSCVAVPDTTISVCGTPTLASVYTRPSYAFYTSSFVSTTNVAGAGIYYGIHTAYAGCADTTQITITINCPPVANNATPSMNEDAILSSSLTATDPDGNLNPNSFTAVTNPANGTLVLNANGTYTYTPNPNFNGTDVFTYSVCDLGTPSKCDTATVTITVNAVNDAPVITPDVNTTNENTPVSGNILTAGDTDPDGTPLVVNTTPVSGPANGTFTIDSLGNYTYTPNPNFNGTDVIVLQVCDHGIPLPTSCKNDTLTITVSPVNDAPIVTPDVNTTNEDTPVNGNILTAGDTDPDGTPLSVNTTPVSGPANGTFTIDSLGNYTYTPNPNFNGTDVIVISVCDNGTPLPAICLNDTLTITVLPVNDAPIVTNNNDTTAEGSPKTGNILSNGDNDTVDGGTLTVNTTPVKNPSNGTITVDALGNYTYTPNPLFSGNDTAIISVCDNGIPTPIICKNDTLFLLVTPVNHAPTIAQVPVTVAEDSTIKICPTINDIDGNPLTVTLCSAPKHGTASIVPTNCVQYTPDPNFNGQDSICIMVCDNGTPALCSQVMVPITVTPVNDAPVITPDVNSTNEDTPVNGNILTAGDTDPDGTPLVVNTTPVSGPANGTFTIDSLGNYTYSPNPNFNGTDVIVLQVCDHGTPLPASCKNDTLTITVSPINDAPIVTPDVNTTNEDTPVSGNILTAGDTDPDGTPLSVNTTPVSGPANGTFTIDSLGNYTYTPNPNFNGTDVIVLQVCDHGTPLPASCKNDTLTITVTPVNDAPIVTPDVNTTNEDTPVSGNILTAGDTDPDGTPLSVNTTPVSGPANGTFTIDSLGNYTYTPNPNFNGTDVIVLQVCDHGIPLPTSCKNDTLTITVSPVNDAPIVTPDVNTTNEDTPVNGNILTAGDTDPDGTPLSVNTTPVSGPANGTFTIDSLGNYTYTPNPNFNGTDVIVLQVCDHGTPLPASCKNDTLTITVSPINDAPIVTNNNDTTSEGSTKTGNILANGDNDSADGGTLTVNTTPVKNPSNGTITVDALGNYTYTPNPLFSGNDTAIISVCDNGIPTPIICKNDTLFLLVTPVNHAPTIAQVPVTVAEDSTIKICPTINDIDGNPLTVTLCSAPKHGTASIVPTNCVQYTPDPNFNGQDSICIMVCDNGTPALCSQVKVPITVIPVNDAPVITPDVNTTNEDTPVSGNILTAGDTDPDGTPLVVNTTPVSGPANGTFTIDSLGNYTYTPNPNFNGTDVIVLQVCDHGIPLPPSCKNDTLTITVSPNNDAPIVTPDVNTTNEDTPVNGYILTAGDTDPDGTPLSVNTKPVSGPANGTFTIDTLGNYTYSPNPNFNGTDVIVLQVCDHGTPLPASCKNDTLTITVSPINDAPIANPNTGTTTGTNPITVNISGNDTDLDGAIDPATVDLDPSTPGIQNTITVPGGTFTVDNLGNVTFTPDGTVTTGNVCTNYTVNDNGLPLPAATSNVSTLCISIGAVPPVANNDANSTNEDTPVTFNITSNDTDPDGTVNPATVDLDPTTPGIQTTATTPQGAWSVDNLGNITFSPALNFNGIATLPYTVKDNTGNVSNIGTITITVNPVNDPIIVSNNTNTTAEDVPVSGSILDAGDFDPDSTLLTPSTTPITGPYHGSIVINPDGTYTYTPNPNYNGPDQVVIQLCDNGIPLPPSCKNDTLNLTVTPVNDAPVANNDVAGTSGLIPVTKSIINNDVDVDGNIDPTTVDLDPSTPGQQTTLTVPGGTFTVDNAGNVTFTPDGTVTSGNVCTNYTVKDNGTPLPAATSNVATFCVTMGNIPPVANNDSTSTNEDTPKTFNITSNDVDADGTINPATVDLDPSTPGIQTTATTPQGTWSVDALGNVTFTPTANFNGVATLPYTVNDNSGATSSPALIVVTVNPVNDPLVVTPDVNTTPEDVPVIGNVISAGDNDNLDGTPVTASTAPAKAPSHGSIVINPNGSYTYTPNPNFNGKDTILIQLCDNGNPLPPTCKNDTLVITVTPVNDAPVANNDVAGTSGTTPVTKNITTNDTDLDGTIDPTTVDLDPSTPGQQTTMTVPGGTFTVDALGNVTFTPDGTVTTGNVCTNYTVNDTGTPLPAATSNVATFCVSMGNLPPVANNDSTSTLEDTPVTLSVTSNDVDADGTINPATVDLDPSAPGIQTTATTPQGAWSVDALGNVTFTPLLNFNGVATLPYTVNDNSGIPSNNATIKITVTAVNDPIVVDNDANTILEDAIANGNVIGAGNSDPDGTPITATTTPLVNPKNGSIIVQPNGNYTYTPNPNWNGKDTIVIQLCDQGIPLPPSCAPDTLIITVLPVNDAPIANPNTGSTSGTTPVTVNITNNDTDIDGVIDPATVDFDPSTPGIQNTKTVPGGTFTVDNLGNVTFTPDGTVSGTQVCTNYTVNDNGTPLPAATSNVSTVCISLGNVAPIITPVTAIVPEDSMITICTPVVDAPAQTLTPTICGATNGVASNVTVVGNQVCVTFKPAPNYNGPASVCVIVCDNGTPSLCDTINIPISVTPVNDPPVTSNYNTTVASGTTVPVNVAAGTSDPDGDLLTYTYGTPSGVPVTVTPTGNGTLVIAPTNSTDTGLVTIQYTVCDNGTPSLCDTGLITIHFIPDSTLQNTNFPPVAVDDNSSTNPGSPVTVNVKGNDTDPNGNNTIGNPTIVTQPTHGTATVDANGNIVYTPNPGFNNANDTIKYSICDNGTPTLCDTAILVISVTQNVTPNHAPVATDDFVTTNEDTPITYNIKGNDSDPDGNPLGNPTIISQPTHGTASIDANGNLVYTPNPNFNGNDTLTYVICDFGIPSLCDTASVIITVLPINDAPIVTNNADTTNEDTPKSGNILLNGDNDSVDGGTLTANTTPVSNPSHGTIVISSNGNYTYTPNSNFNGNDTAVISVCDNGIPLPAICKNDTLVITVLPINDAPIVTNNADTTNEDTPKSGNILLNGDNDNADGGTLTSNTTPVSNPSHGTIVVSSNGNYTYTPNSNFNGNDTAVISVCDNGIPLPAICKNDTLVITVNPINDAPIVTNNSDTTNEGSPKNGNILMNGDNDNADGGTLTTNTTPVSNPSHGTIVVSSNGNYTYTPNPFFVGNDTMVISVCDNGTPLPAICKNDTLVITVLPINHAPVTSDYSTTVLEGTPVPVNIAAGTSDPDGDLLTYTYGTPNGVSVIIMPTGNGTLVVSPTNPTDTGYVTIPFTVCDNGTPSLCDSGKITIHFVPDSILANTNYAPLAVDDRASTNPNTAITINVKGNDTDPNGNNTLGNPSVISNPSNGTVVVNSNGTVTYTPNANYIGNDTFQYVVCDNGTPSKCDTAFVFVSITPNVTTNHKPVATDDFATTPEDTPITIPVTSNDSDPDGNLLGNPTIISNPTHGTAIVDANGNVVYTPNHNYNGNDTLTYVICDNGTPSLCDTAVVIITITAVNDAPIVHNETNTTPINTAVSGSLNNGDVDPEGGILTYGSTPISGPKHGTIVIDSAGNYTYTPNSGYVGNDTIVTTVCDNGNPVQCTNDTLFILVTPIKLIANHDEVGSTSNPLGCDGITYDVMANDSIEAGITPIVTITNVPIHGSATIVDGHFIKYVPKKGFVGTDMLTYQLEENGVKSFATVEFIVNCPTEFFPHGFSPNGDGKNDYLVIKGIENYPSSELVIFNRWGNEVYRKENGYKNDWDGKYNNENLPDGTYFYILKFNDGVNADKSGYLIIQH